MLILWDVSNGNIVAQMNGHTESVYTLCFSRCGSVLASGMYKVLILLDVSNGNMVAQMNGHTESVYTLCFSLCGSVLASGMYKC